MGKGKRRNSSKVRPQDYDDDAADASFARHTQANATVAPAESPLERPAYVPLKAKSEDQGAYHEGLVVVCPNTTKTDDVEPTRTGTIFMLYGGEAHVLDAQGYIHSVPLSKIYLAQN